VLRAVLDTNIIVRMVLSKPSTLAGKLFRALQESRFLLVLTPAIVEEMIGTLLSPHMKAKHGWEETTVRSYVEDLVLISHMTEGTHLIEIPSLEQRDPEDVKMLAAAVEGGADFLVTQDRDLLVLEKWEGVRIVELPEFYQVLMLLIDE
jgi:hypothetical protein